MLPGTAGLAGLTWLAVQRAMSRRLANQDRINHCRLRFREMSRRRIGISGRQVAAVWRRHGLECIVNTASPLGPAYYLNADPVLDVFRDVKHVAVHRNQTERLQLGRERQRSGKYLRIPVAQW